MEDFVSGFYKFVSDNFGFDREYISHLSDLRFFFLVKVYFDVLIAREVMKSEYYEFSRDAF